MKKILFIVLLSQMMYMDANAQTAQFEKIVDDLFFRIASYRTDSVTTSFLRNHIPFLLEKPTAGEWSVKFGIDENYIDKSYIVVHTLELKKHPYYYNFNTSTCSLSIFTKVENGFFQCVNSRTVTFTFIDKISFDKAYHDLTVALEETATHSYLHPIKQMNIIGFEDKKSKESNINTVQLEWRFDVLSNRYILNIHNYIDYDYFKEPKQLKH